MSSVKTAKLKDYKFCKTWEDTFGINWMELQSTAPKKCPRAHLNN